MIYVASPYTSEDRTVLSRRFICVREYTAHLMASGQVCFSPIVYGHQFVRDFEGPMDFLSWQAFNDRILTLACSSVHVLKLSGWENSRGIAHELNLAKKHHLPITYVEPLPHAVI